MAEVVFDLIVKFVILFNVMLRLVLIKVLYLKIGLSIQFQYILNITGNKFKQPSTERWFLIVLEFFLSKGKINLNDYK